MPFNVTVSWMDYSVATAGIDWRSVALDVALLVLVGLPLLYSAWRNRSSWAREGQTFKLLVAVAIGAVFTLGGLFGMVRGAYASVECMNALSAGRVERSAGPVSLVSRFEKPGAGYAIYRVGEAEFRTNEGGVSCDCGYFVSFGREHRLRDGQEVEVWLLRGRALAVRSPSVES